MYTKVKEQHLHLTDVHSVSDVDRDPIVLTGAQSYPEKQSRERGWRVMVIGGITTSEKGSFKI